MSVWMLGFLLFGFLNSEAHAEDDRKPTIGEQLDVIIKDVSEYLLWLFGYDEESVEDQIEMSESMADDFLKDVNGMIELMHEEAEKHIKHAKDIRKIENEKDKKDSYEKVNSEEEILQEETRSDDASETEEKEKQGFNIEVIPILNV